MSSRDRREWQTVAESWTQFSGAVCACKSCQKINRSAFLAGYMASSWNLLTAMHQFAEKDTTEESVSALVEYAHQRWEEALSESDDRIRALGEEPNLRH